MCRPVRLGLGRRHEAELGRVGLAHDHEPGPLELLEERARRRGHVARGFQRFVARVIRRARERAVEVFDDDRLAGERSFRKTVRDRSTRPLVQRVDDRVELTVDLLDAIDRGVNQFCCRRAATAHELRLRSRIEK